MQTIIAETVVGIRHRRGETSAFVDVACEAEMQGPLYGFRREHQPDNPHDRNAIVVFGFADRKGWLNSGTWEW